jgi:uncharacterized protein (DUF2126 family)
LYALARECGLTAETFALDGRHSGTGGGSHLTLGGPDPHRSPLLARPDLLVSLLTFWQHHPSLSYLFSGRFVGSTSQAPRVDEGRPENLYELEIAFAEIARLAGPATPSTGRAAGPGIAAAARRHHRQHPSVGVLRRQAVQPDALRGRLGLLELRGFEMTPHPDMALVQALLVRALVARFAEQPYSAPLVRWGTALHERFLLPHFALADLAGWSRTCGRTSSMSTWPGSRSSRVPLPAGRDDDGGRGRTGAAVGGRAVGTCWARRRPPGRQRAMSTPRPSDCRSG